ncbi:hypothetical protein ACRRTK_016626 [Alexandromys fortis]
MAFLSSYLVSLHHCTECESLGHSRGAPVCAHSDVPADGLRAQGPASSPAKQPS